MADLFKKLNVLVRAGIHDIIGDDRTDSRSTAGRQLLPQWLGKDVDGEVKALRERVNKALDYEEHLVGRVTALQSEAATLDEQADQAVDSGAEEQARRLVAQHQVVQQRLAMAESDLREHRIVTQELIQRVNELEAAVADARRRAEQMPDNEPSVEARPDRLVSDVLREMRTRIDEMGDLLQARDEVNAPSTTEQVDAAVDSQNVDDDLARRRDRLSKK